MFNKLNLKTLIIILAALVGIYFISTLSGNKERSFRSIIVEVDTANVSNIQIQSANLDLSLVRTGQLLWELNSGGKNFVADGNVVKTILSQFVSMRPERVAATSPDRWEDYEVDDENGIRVILKDGKKSVADLYIGKFSFSQPPQSAMQNPTQQQQRGKMTSFVRPADSDQVYAVEGFLKMAYQDDVNTYRVKNLVNVNKEDITNIEFSYPNLSMSLMKEDNNWLLNGQPADSAKAAKYINSIYRLTSSNFVDPSTPKTGDAAQKVTIIGNNFSPIDLKVFPTSDTLINHIITSSINPDAEFDGSKLSLYEKVFVDETAFLPDGN
jgi:hypothetical protein